MKLCGQYLSKVAKSGHTVQENYRYDSTLSPTQIVYLDMGVFVGVRVIEGTRISER